MSEVFDWCELSSSDPRLDRRTSVKCLKECILNLVSNTPFKVHNVYDFMHIVYWYTTCELQFLVFKSVSFEFSTCTNVAAACVAVGLDRGTLRRGLLRGTTGAGAGELIDRAAAAAVGERMTAANGATSAV